MKVKRRSRFQVSSQTPNWRPTRPAGPTSLRRRNGSPSAWAHWRFRSGGSAEMPTIWAPRASYFRASSRNRENSSSQPLVNAFR